MRQGHRSAPWWLLAGTALSAAALATGCKSVTTSKKDPMAYFVPSNQRVWSPDQAVLPTADIGRDEVLVRNVRNCKYLSADDYVVDYYDRLIALGDLVSVDYIVVPFQAMPTMAHTMVSFGTRDGQQIVVSVEIRKEAGESYSVVKGLLNEFEIMYVVADERDVIDLRARHRGDDVYVYPLRANPEQAQAIFVDMVRRANQLAERPEFYNTVSNNCTTSLLLHFNRIAKRPISAADPRVILPGLSDQLLYELGLIDTNVSFEETKRRANVSPLARQHRDNPDYSQAIRANWYLRRQ
ncbi:MAG: hypothetical protein DCC68_12020 [Planctomycetota bacterium]|nr:MAG: hypothetical protein DCC68_12020 [Planctomycetota bacterium]